MGAFQRQKESNRVGTCNSIPSCASKIALRIITAVLSLCSLWFSVLCEHEHFTPQNTLNNFAEFKLQLHMLHSISLLVTHVPSHTNLLHQDGVTVHPAPPQPSTAPGDRTAPINPGDTVQPYTSPPLPEIFNGTIKSFHLDL